MQILLRGGGGGGGGGEGMGDDDGTFSGATLAARFRECNIATIHKKSQKIDIRPVSVKRFPKI